MDETITVVRENCTKWKLHVHPNLVVVNPPWGIRKRSEMPPFELIPSLKQSWKELGQFLWQNCKGKPLFNPLFNDYANLGAKVYFPCNHPFLYRQLGLYITERSPLWIGGTQLGFYGVHLHNTESLNRHRHKRPRSAPDLEPRSSEDRAIEIQTVQQHLSSQLTEDLSHQRQKSLTSNEEKWSVFYNWKLRKYQPLKVKS